MGYDRIVYFNLWTLTRWACDILILSHNLKFIFFHIPKTGGTTAEVVLRQSGVFDFDQDVLTGVRDPQLPSINLFDVEKRIRPNWVHARPIDLIKFNILSLQEIKQYDCYAFVRQSEERFVSAYHHCARSREGYSLEQFARDIDSRPSSELEIMHRPQSDWLFVDGEQVTHPLLYSQFEDELRWLLNRIGGDQFTDIPHLNRTIL